MKITEIFIPGQFLLFLLVGGTAAIVNFTTRFFYDDVMSFGSAVACSYITGMILAFSLMRLFVFGKTTKGIKKEGLFFLLVNCSGLAITWSISVALAEYFFPIVGFHWHRYEVAHIIGICAPGLTSYLGHKYLTFR